MKRTEYKIPDFKLLLAVYLLLAFGISMLYSASINISQKLYNDQYYIFRAQFMWLIIGTIFLLATMSIDYHLYQKVSRIIILFVIILLVAVLFPPIGKKISGSRSWIRFGIIGFQPSEFAKFGLIIYLAAIFAKKKKRVNTFFEGYLPPLIITSIIFFLILLEPDFGTGIVVALIAGIIFFIAGIKFTYIASTFFLLLPVAYFLIEKVRYRKSRLIAFLNPWSDPSNKGYHIIQSIKSFTLGGITGVGIGKGVQKLWYLPQPHTDFIFPVIGEETGLIGVSILILLFLFIIFRGIKIAYNAPDKFGFLLASGVVIKIALETFFNIAVTVGLLPVTGLPLPFVSYGGSSLIVNMLCIGILLNVSSAIKSKVETLEVINIEA